MKKELRVKKNREFSQIIDEKKRLSSVNFVVYKRKKAQENARIGISVSKKIGNAVIRNRIKRQIRMMCLAIIDFDNYPNDVIIIVKKAYINNNFQDNINDLEKLLKKDII